MSSNLGIGTGSPKIPGKEASQLTDSSGTWPLSFFHRVENLLVVSCRYSKCDCRDPKMDEYWHIKNYQSWMGPWVHWYPSFETHPCHMVMGLGDPFLCCLYQFWRNGFAKMERALIQGPMVNSNWASLRGRIYFNS